MTQRAEQSGGSRLYAATRHINRFLDSLTDILAFVGMSALIGAIGIVVVDIIWRRIGGQSLVGAVDLTQFCVMAAASWAIPYAFSAHAHVTVDLIGKNRFRSVLKFVDALIPLLCAGLMAFLLYLSWGRAMEQLSYGDVSQNLAIPMILFWGFLLSGMAISTLVCLGQFMKLLLKDENN
ncbi:MULTISPECIES: TRAP transporter small permease [Thalassospira]|uniref:TRAP transporter small permease protein n=2 Tax=Thalassospira TaxID=168934 RepID=A0A367W3Z7_9PROT|nr:MULTISPECIES: TRAP transporter small permease [Thalassospira]MDG4720843.1 TRAP transporter small permease [Thalassospira sp. FZY0004]RCK34959.1 hypothetical protein TH19_14670 [Thalassospira profundimaris]